MSERPTPVEIVRPGPAGQDWHGQQCRALIPSVGTTNVPCPCPSSFGGAA